MDEGVFLHIVDCIVWYLFLIWFHRYLLWQLSK